MGGKEEKKSITTVLLHAMNTNEMKLSEHYFFANQWMEGWLIACSSSDGSTLNETNFCFVFLQATLNFSQQTTK